MTLIQRVELLAKEVEKLGEGGGGGGDLSAYLTKTEASSTYETQSAAATSLALKADKATTYTKEEVDEEIATVGSVSDSMYSSTTLVPLEVGIPTSCDVPWSHIMKENDFTLLKTVNDTTYAVRFQYSQSTGRYSFMYKGSLVLPSGSYLHTYIVEMSPAAD